MPVELIVGAAVGAAVASPNARKTIRRGLIYGVAGVLAAYDKVAAITHGVVKGAREKMTKAPAAAQETNGQAHAATAELAAGEAAAASRPVNAAPTA
jgi:hypothetical protein